LFFQKGLIAFRRTEMRAALHVTSNLRVTICCKKKYKQRWKKISRKKRIDITKSTLRTGADERKRNMRINSHGMVFR